jgi:hypothetical protein
MGLAGGLINWGYLPKVKVEKSNSKINVIGGAAPKSYIKLCNLSSGKSFCHVVTRLHSILEM